jgi:hypothetical protein
MRKGVNPDQSKAWEICVVRIDGLKSGTLESVHVPMHKMGKPELQSFLKALLAKHSLQDAESLLENFVNRRKGDPQFRSAWELKDSFDQEKKRSGYYCGETPLFAFATYPLAEAEVAAIAKIQSQNRKAM